MQLFIATPMYGGQCYGAYTDSLIKLCTELRSRGTEFRYFPIFNESHIDRARNVCADEFLRSGFTHLIFIDGDLSGYKPEQVIDLMGRDKEIICGFYPKKCINWKRVADAVRKGFDEKLLPHIIGDLVFTPALNRDSSEFRSIYDLTPIHEGGTGFMLIRREALLKIAEANPERMYHRNHKDRDMMTAFFDAQVEPEWQVTHRRFLTEDYDFCRLARNASIQVWLAPWIKLVHHGYYQFIGDIEAIAATQQQPAEAAE